MRTTENIIHVVQGQLKSQKHRLESLYYWLEFLFTYWYTMKCVALSKNMQLSISYVI